ncbi:MAG: hypothetical protein RLO52_34585 [Sandaracinaceae bacterium]
MSAAAEQLPPCTAPCTRCARGWVGGQECRACLGSGLRHADVDERARPLPSGAIEQVTDRLVREFVRRRRTDAQYEAGAVARALRLEAPEAVLPMLLGRGYEAEDARALATHVVAAVEERAAVLGLWVRSREGAERASLRAWTWKAREAIK